MDLCPHGLCLRPSGLCLGGLCPGGLCPGPAQRFGLTACRLCMRLLLRPGACLPGGLLLDLRLNSRLAHSVLPRGLRLHLHALCLTGLSLLSLSFELRLQCQTLCAGVGLPHRAVGLGARRLRRALLVLLRTRLLLGEHLLLLTRDRTRRRRDESS